jgi:hypothetical protein
MGRWIALFLLCLLSLGFGAASLCGAVFSFSGLAEGGRGYAGAALMIGLPSLFVGGLLCWLCLRGVRKVWRKLQAPSDTPTEPKDPA